MKLFTKFNKEATKRPVPRNQKLVDSMQLEETKLLSIEDAALGNLIGQGGKGRQQEQTVKISTDDGLQQLCTDINSQNGHHSGGLVSKKRKPPGDSMVGSKGNAQQMDVNLRSLRFVVSGACDGAC